MIGKTNLDQFATGLVGTRSPYGVPRNALRADLIPGGSSSGSAVAVGAGLIPFSLGTDTAGSGRVPAALNGIVGLKPSLGALSASGVVPACRTLDTISIFALDVADAFKVFEAAAAFDRADAWSRPFPAPARSGWPKGVRLGVPRRDQLEFFGDTEAEAAFGRDVAAAQALGANVVEFDIEPFAEVARLLYEGPWVAERYAATKPLIEKDPGALHPVTRAIIEGARKFDAVAAFEASYKLASLRRRTQGAWAGVRRHGGSDHPAPLYGRRSRGRPGPPELAARDVHEFRQSARPCGHRLPIGHARRRAAVEPDADRLLRALMDTSPVWPPRSRPAPASRWARPGSPFRRLRPCRQRRPPAASRSRWSARISPDCRSIPNSSRSAASFLREAETTSDYRLYALPGSKPPKPGLLRVADGEGAAIRLELWTLDKAGFGAFVAGIPAPLGIGTIRLSDGSSAKGFLVEAEAVKGAEDITKFGGWRAYLSAR